MNSYLRIRFPSVFQTVEFMDENDVSGSRQVNVPLRELRDLLESHKTLSEDLQKVSHIAAVAQDELENARHEAEQWEAFAEKLYDRHDKAKDFEQ